MRQQLSLSQGQIGRWQRKSAVDTELGTVIKVKVKQQSQSQRDTGVTSEKWLAGSIVTGFQNGERKPLRNECQLSPENVKTKIHK